jgi:protease PrsW
VAILIGIVVALACGLLPMLAYAAILWWFDRYEKEPAGLLVAAFLWGAVPAVVFSLVAELVLGVPVALLADPAAAGVINTALIAPVAEEAFKGLAVVLLFLFYRRELDSPLDGILYGGLVGFGFAAVENVFYFTGALLEAGLTSMLFLALLRAFLFGLNHALFTGFTGLGLALARTERRWPVKIGAPLAGLAAGTAAHLVHNVSVTLAPELFWPCVVALAADWGGALVLLAVIVWTSLRERRWIVEHLRDEVERGTLNAARYATAASYPRRTAERARALFAGDFRRWLALGRYYRLATELAFNKHRLTRFPGEVDTQARMLSLRQQVSELGSRL